jgi:hypothetical protein
MTLPGVFPQRRSFERAIRQALGGLVCLGRRTLSRIIWTNGGQNCCRAAEYFLHSRCCWDPQRLFAPILKRALPWCSGNYIGVAVDDTRLHKTGKVIQQAYKYRRNSGGGSVWKSSGVLLTGWLNPS